MNANDPANPWSKLLTTPPTTTVESILRYPAHGHDYRRHLADYEATRIEPGADPRAEPLFTCGPSAAYVDGWRGEYTVEAALNPEINELWQVRVLGERSRYYRGCTYIPFDVARWRNNSGHRARLTERARAYAALQPEAKR